ncbi:multicopper oxidase domain-containing protein [Bacillus sanguinis]
MNNYPGTNEKKKLADATSTSESITSLSNTDAKERVTKTFNITAKVASVDLGNGKKVDAWTFDGTSPGTEIRVKQGERIVVNLKNELPEPVTIHWHGLDVPAAVDGVPGVTQNAIKPGETYTYAFNADQVGTYWYHSHQKECKTNGAGTIWNHCY